MFHTEGLGIDSKENAIADYESVKIKDFENSITFEDGHYNVKLPWNEDVFAAFCTNTTKIYTFCHQICHFPVCLHYQHTYLLPSFHIFTFNTYYLYPLNPLTLPLLLSLIKLRRKFCNCRIQRL